MSDKVIDILGKEQLDAIIAAGGIVIVDFWAEWCGPCRMLGPVLHEIAEANEGVVVAKINVDAEENGELSMEYGVRSIPQVTLFKDGGKVDQFVGALPPEQVQAYIDKYK
jgi:thioredoxin 1